MISFITDRFCELWATFNKKWTELLLGFLVVLLGIFVSFRFEDWRQSSSSDYLTRERLHMAYLETHHNMKFAHELYNLMNSQNQIRKRNDFEIKIGHPSILSAQEALNDSNLRTLISPENVLQLRAYVHVAQTLSDINNSYQEFIFESNYQIPEEVLSFMMQSFQQKIKKNAKELLAQTLTFRQEARESFVDIAIYKSKDSRLGKKAIENRVEEYRKMIDSGSYNIEELKKKGPPPPPHGNAKDQGRKKNER